MSATYLTVTIGGNEYDVYADLATADVYLAAEPNAALWREDNEEENSRALVSATRIFNRLPWKGSKTEADQALAWPRTETGVDGVEDDAIPQAIIDGSIELANAIRNGYDASNLASTASGIKRQKAGSVEIEYFAGGSATEGQRLPLPVMELIDDYLAGDDADFPSTIASGTDGASSFETSWEPTQGI